LSRLASRVIAITGASAGIGRATAEACAREGAAVALFARRADRLDELARGITQRGGRVLAVAGDVTVVADVERFVDRTAAELGGLDVMVCNAGIGFHGALDQTPPEAMRRLVDVNVLGTFYAAQAALRIFRRSGRGHIIAVSSIAGRRGVGGTSIYSATKAAQIAFIEGLRAELADTGIRASSILPVRADTEFHGTIQREFGQAAKTAGPHQSAEVVAESIVRCIVSPKPEVYPYRAARWLSIVNVLSPATADRIMRRHVRRPVVSD
jgi:NADP-dependent 3-hydroxy acid dehydrogenase YdfG